jgi:hypothetical protein
MLGFALAILGLVGYGLFKIVTEGFEVDVSGELFLALFWLALLTSAIALVGLLAYGLRSR